MPGGLELEEAELRARGKAMADLIYITVTVLFFIVAIAYVEFCDRVR